MSDAAGGHGAGLGRGEGGAMRGRMRRGQGLLESQFRRQRARYGRSRSGTRHQSQTVRPDGRLLVDLKDHATTVTQRCMVRNETSGRMVCVFASTLRQN